MPFFQGPCATVDVACSWPPHFAHVFLPYMQAVCSSNSDIRREGNCRACDRALWLCLRSSSWNKWFACCLPCFSSLAHMVRLPGQCCSQPLCNSGRPLDCRRDHILQHTRSPRKYILAPPKLGTRPRLMKTCQLHPSSAAVLSTVLVSSMQLSGIIVTLQRSQSWASHIFHHCRYCRRKGFNYPFIKQSPSTLTSVSCFLGFVLYHSSLPASCQENREGGLI